MPRKKMRNSYSDKVTQRAMSERIDAAMEAKYGEQLGVTAFIKKIEEKRGGGNAPSESLFSKIRTAEVGKLPNMTADNLIAIAETLDVSVDYLLGLTPREYVLKEGEMAKYGLSDKALRNLEWTKKESDGYDAEKVQTTSAYYRNPCDKRLRMVNWILEHLEVSKADEEYDHDDFLITLYHLVMNNFDAYKGNIMEAVLDSVRYDSTRKWNKYQDAIKNERLSREASYKSESLRDFSNDLKKARREYVEEEGWNMERRKIIKSYLEKGIVPVSDPLTFEEIWIKLPSPEGILRERMDGIINAWHGEYQDEYKRQTNMQNKENQKWIESVKRQYPAYEAKAGGSDVLPEENVYGDMESWGMSEEKMKLYQLCEYIEGTELKHMRFDADNEVHFSNRGDFSDEEFRGIILKAGESGMGLVLRDDGEVLYDADRASLSKRKGSADGDPKP